MFSFIYVDVILGLLMSLIGLLFFAARCGHKFKGHGRPEIPKGLRVPFTASSLPMCADAV